MVRFHVSTKPIDAFLKVEHTISFTLLTLNVLNQSDALLAPDASLIPAHASLWPLPNPLVET